MPQQLKHLDEDMGGSGGRLGRRGGEPAGRAGFESDVPASAAAGDARLGYLLEMMRQLKRMAQADGLTQLALLLEMAELEAGDALQRRGGPCAR